MTAEFAKHDIQFMYPENWVISENEDPTDFIEISLESPEGSIWSVSIFPENTDTNDLIENTADALKDQYQDFERSDFEGELGRFQSVGFEAHFYCLDFLVTAVAQSVSCHGKCLHIFYQAESRDFDKNAQVFDAINLSLIRSLG